MKSVHLGGRLARTQSAHARSKSRRLVLLACAGFLAFAGIHAQAQLNWTGNGTTAPASPIALGSYVRFTCESYSVYNGQHADTQIDWSNDSAGWDTEPDMYWWYQNGNNNVWSNWVQMTVAGTHEYRFHVWDDWGTHVYSSPTATYTVTNLPWSTSCYVTNGLGPESMGAYWTAPSPYWVMVVRRLGAWPDAPTGGTSYTNTQTYGTDNRNVIVSASGSGSYAIDQELLPATSSNYYYAFFTENFGYYSVSTGVVYSGRAMNASTPAFQQGEHVDSFAYFAPHNVDSVLSRGTNWAGYWWWWNGTMDVQAGSLTGAVNYPTPWGNKLHAGPGVTYWHGTYRNFLTAYTTGALYFAYVIRPTTPGGNTWCGMSIFEDDAERVFIGAPGGSTAVSIQKTGSAATASSYTMSGGNDNTIVFKYDFSTFNAYVKGYFKTDTIPLTEPADWGATQNLGATYIDSINRVVFNSGGWSGGDVGDVYYDEVRVAKSWKELLRLSEPTWDGGGADTHWDNPDNWVGNVVPATTTNATFYDGIASGANIYLHGNQSIDGLRFNSSADTSLAIVSNTLTLGAGGIAIDSGAAGSHSLGSTLSLGANQSWTNDSSATFSSTNRITGAGNLTKTGSGTVLLNYGSAANDFTGTLTINNGPVRIVKANSLGGVGSGTTVNSGGALELAPNSGTTYAAEPLTLAGDGVSGGGALRNIQYNNDRGGAAITLTNNTRIASDSGTLTIGADADISGAGYRLTVSGAGTVAIWGDLPTGAASLVKDGTGTNDLYNFADLATRTWTGPTIVSNGLLRLQNSNSISDASAVIVNSPATFDVNNVNDTVGSIAGTGTIAIGNGELRAGADNTSTIFAGLISGTSGRLVKQGTGTLTLTNDNTLGGAGVGGMTVQEGTLSVPRLVAAGTAQPLGDSTAADAIILGSAGKNGTLQYTGPNSTSTKQITLATGGTGVVEITTAATLLTNSGAHAGSGALAKTGSGTLQLSGNSTYSGATLVNAGTLVLSGTASNSAATVASGATLLGAGAASSVAVSGTINPGNYANGQGSFSAVSASLNASGTYRWEISNVAGTPGAQWDLINVGGGSGTVTVNATDGADFVIDVYGNPTGFSSSSSYTWTIIDAGAVAGFVSNKFTISTSNFSPAFTGTFTIGTNTSGDIVLNYAAPASQEIDVLGTNHAVITSGDVTPITGDGTDYGAVAVSGSTVDHTFFITNSGTAQLTVSGVATSGTGAADFFVLASPTAVEAGTRSNLTIRFDPSVVGTRTATITVNNNDSNEGTYTFVVQGTGTWAGILRSPTSFNVSSTLGSAPSAFVFGVTNVGYGTLSYTVSTNAGWLTVLPVSGSLATWAGRLHTGTIAVAGGLQAGVSNATITLTDAAASNSPQTITVAWTINAVPNPSSWAATADGNELVRLNWTKDASYDVMIVHRAGSAPTDPQQGASYSVGSACGGGTVVYKGSGSYLDHVLQSGTTHYYEFYSYNGNYYSTGVTANATLGSYRAGEITEPFAYTNGVSLNAINGGVGWTNAWAINGAWTAQTNAELCTFANMPAYPSLAANRAKLADPGNASNGTARRHFAAVSSGKIYASVMMAYRYEGANKWAGLSFMRGNVETGFVGKGSGANWYTLAISSYGGAVSWGSDFRGLENSTNNTFLLIAKYDFDTDVLSVKAYSRSNSVPTAEPASWDVSVTVPGGGISAIDGVRLGAGCSDAATVGDCFFDDLRVATTWNNLLGITQPVVTNYSVNTSNYVSDAQVTGGAFNVSMTIRDLSGVVITNNGGTFFAPNFDLWNLSGIQILTDEVFSSFAFTDSGREVLGSDASHAGYWPGDLGVYTSRVSMVNSNGVSTVDTTTLSNGTTVMSFTVYDDDTTPPVVGYVTTNSIVPNGGMETNGAGWSGWGSSSLRGFAAYAAENGSYGGWITNFDGGAGGSAVSHGYWMGSHIPGIVGGAAYRWSLRMRMVGPLDPGAVDIAVQQYDSASNWLDEAKINVIGTMTTNWQTFILDFTNHASTAVMQPYVQIWNDTRGTLNGRLDVDNVYLGRGAGVGTPLTVLIGTAAVTGDTVNALTTNAVYTITDAAMTNISASNPLFLRFGGYDVDSGLSRDSNNVNSQMNIDIGTWTNDDVAHYSANDSSPYAATLAEGATSTWRWTSFSAADIASLYSASPNVIAASLFDADYDRDSDRLVATNKQYGYLTVSDDDAVYPYLGSINQVDNPGVETNGALWSYWGSGCGPATWAAESGSYGMYVQHNSDGGCYQDEPALSNTVYVLTARARKGANFTANPYIKIEFKDSGYSDVGAANQTDLQSLLTADWATYTVIATSPASGVSYVRPVIGIYDIGGSGASTAMFDNVNFIVAPMQVWIGTTNINPGLLSGANTTLVYNVYDGTLKGVGAANQLRFVFSAYDTDSGLSRGTTDANEQMNVSIGSWKASDVNGYNATNSSAASATYALRATSTWSFAALSSNEITTLLGTNAVLATVRDNDTDRAGDRLSISNRYAGTVVVTDDDTVAPVIASENLLVHPGFETNGGAWNIWSEASLNGWAAETGTNGLGLHGWAAGGSGGADQSPPGAPYATYVFSVNAVKEANYDAQETYLKIDFLNASSNVIATVTNQIMSALTTSWQTYSVTGTAPVGTAYVKPIVGMYNASALGNPQACKIDNAVLRHIPVLTVSIGSTYYSPSGHTTNAVFIINKADLEAVSGANPFRLVFGAYDSGSGLARGTTDSNTQMNVDLGSIYTDNVTNYTAGESTADGTAGYATSTWKWVSFSPGQISALNGLTNAIRISVPDADDDRANDQSWVVNQLVGYIIVTSPGVGGVVIHDWFDGTVGNSISGSTGGSGWTNAWALGGDPFVNFDSGSLPSGYSSYIDPTEEKIVMYGDVTGRYVTATRHFTNFTSGRMYFSFLMNYEFTGANKWAGLKFVSGDTESAFIGKTAAGDKTFGIDGDVDTNSTTVVLEGGTGNDYLIAGVYDFATHELSASSFRMASDGSCEMVAEEPVGYWQVSTIQTAGYITSIDGVRLHIGADSSGQIGDVYMDEVRVGTNWFEVTRKDGLEYADAMASGPFPKLIYVGTNYTAGATNDLTITDGQLINLTDPLDFAVLWTNLYGVFMTNANGTFNIGSREGRVTPNWDPVTLGSTTNALGLDTNFTGFVGGNGALSVTTYVTSAFTITNSSVGDTYFITLSAENNNLSGGTITAPNGADDVPVRRAITINSNVQFYVTDDDTTNPVLGTLGTEYMQVKIGSTYYSPITNAGTTNAVFLLYDSYFALGSNSTAGGGLSGSLQNPAFDGNADSWTKPTLGGDNIAWYDAAAGANAGGSGGGIKFDAYEPGGRTGMYYQAVACTNDAVVTFSALMRQNQTFSTTFFGTRIQFLDSSDAVLGTFSSSTPVDTTSQRISVTGTAPAGSVNVRCILVMENTPGISDAFGYADSCELGGGGSSGSSGAGSTNFTLVFKAYDTGSGLARNTVGPETNMNVTIGIWKTNDVIHYNAAQSTTPATSSSATSSWTWASLTLAEYLHLEANSDNKVTLAVPDADLERTDDQLWVTNQMGFLRIADDDPDGPNATLIYVGTNFLWSDGWNENNRHTEVTDGDFVAGGKIDIVYSWYDPSGVFLTNNNGALNVYDQVDGKPRNVCPNWDMTNEVAGDLGFNQIHYSTNLHGYNGALIVTALVYNIASIAPANNAIGSLWSLTVSAQDLDDDLGNSTNVDSAPNTDPYVPLDREIRTNQTLYFTVGDDDTNGPTYSRVTIVGGNQTNLRAGSIAILGLHSDATKMFSFVALDYIGPGTYINFTDDGWDTNTSAFVGGEGILRWVSPSTVLNPGTVVHITGTTTATTGTVSEIDAGFDLSASGDQILAYQATAASTTFLYAISMAASGGWLSTGTPNANQSYLPPGLTLLYTEQSSSTHLDNGYFTTNTLSGTRESILTNVSADASWTWGDDPVAFPSWSITVADPVVYIEISDGAPETGFSITGLVQDVGSGIYRVGPNTLAPTVTVYNSSGTAIGGNYFTNLPSSDGDAKSAASPLQSAIVRFTPDSANVYTALLVATDYDVDRTGDSLSTTQRIIIALGGDDDTEAPAVGSNPFQVRIGDSLAPTNGTGTGTNITYRVTDGNLVSASRGGNLLVNGDFETGDNTGWSVWDDASIYTWAAETGTYGIALRDWNASDSPPHSGGFYQDVSGVTVGELYTFSIRAFKETSWSGTNLLIKLEFLDGSSAHVAGTTNDIVRSASAAWNTFVAQGRVPAGASKARVVIEFAGGTNDGGANTSLKLDNAWLSLDTNPVQLVFNTYDAGSGLKLMGADDPTRYMNITWDGLTTNNVINYIKSESSDPTTGTASSNAWLWPVFSFTEVTNLLPIGSTGQAYKATANIADADNDRTGDTLWRSNQQFGFVYVVDDDTNEAVFGGSTEPGNLLFNGSFEQEGSWTGAAWHWEFDGPDHHGGTVGNYTRHAWRSHSGTWAAAIPGTWSNHTFTYGGWWQEVTNGAGAGAAWEASAWFWSDNTGSKIWTASWASIEIEFYDATETNKLLSNTNYVFTPGETWTYYTVGATAPVGAAYTRVWINANGVASGDVGALDIDDVRLFVHTNVAVDVLIGDKSFYNSGVGTNATFLITDGDFASVSSTNLLKFVFNAYDPTSGLLRSTSEQFMNYDIGAETELQDFYSNYQSNWSSASTLAGTATSVFAHVTNFSMSYSSSETGMIYKLFAASTNIIGLSVPDADEDRGAGDRQWMVNRRVGDIIVTDDDTNGPVHWIVYVGTNWTWGSSSTNPVSDSEFTNGIDLVWGVWDYSGVFLTNSDASSTNTDSGWGAINPNWDLHDPMTNFVYDEAIPAASAIFSPRGNSSANATMVLQNLSISYNANTVGVWTLRMSSEDMDRDRGYYVSTNQAGHESEVSFDRAVAANEEKYFTVYDDDSDAPRYASNANTRPMGVWIGSSNVAGSAVTTNAVFRLTDGDLASVGGTNLLSNFSFESGNSAGWAYNTGWRISNDPIDANSGGWGAVNDVLTNELWAEYRVLSQEVPASEGEVYDASVFIRASSDIENSFSYLELQFRNSAGTLIEPGGQFQSSYVTDDQAFTRVDITGATAPAGTVTVSVRGVVAVIDTNYPTTFTNVDFHIFDDFMLKKDTRPFDLVFSAYDGTSGLSRPGTDIATDMNVDVGSWVVNNLSNYLAGVSSDDTTANTATNFWRWDNLNPFDIEVLYQGGSNKVTVSLFDQDDDRIGDTASLIDQQFGYLYVTDDDTLPPETRTISFAGITNKYLIVATNTSGNGMVSDRWQEGGDMSPSNTGWRITDGYIAALSVADPMYFALGAVDIGSGLSRGTEGETNTITVVSIGNQVVGSASKTSYDASLSSADGPNVVATNVWTFDGDPDLFTDSVISNLVTVGTSTVYATMVDSDNDRATDQAVVYTQKVGFLAVIDDDNASPNLTSMRYNSGTGTTDDDLRQSGLSITGLIQDASGIWNSDTIELQIFSPTVSIWGVQYMNDSVIADGGATTDTPFGKAGLSVDYGDRILGTWTALVTSADYDNDGWTGDSKSGTSNFTFEVTDEDSAPPALSGLSIGGSGDGLSASDLIISEYVEGSSFNKYIEFFNGTGGQLVLSNYYVFIYTDGATTPSSSNKLQGTLDAGGVYVISVSGASGWGGTPNQTIFGSYNGNDAIALMHAGATVDVLGTIGDGTMWGAETTLVRNITVTDPSELFDTAEWTGYAADTFDYLGSHMGPVTDGDLASSSLSITSMVRDVGNGIYADGALEPHYTIREPGGTVIVNNDTFTTKPADDGDAKDAPEPLADTVVGFTHANIVLGTHTALVTVTDYDDDRPSDTLTYTSSVAFLVVDDDTNAPVVGGVVPNLLRNASFEAYFNSGYWFEWATYWKQGYPDYHGESWGTASCETWREITGDRCGAIRGTWSGWGDRGGMWQEVTNGYAAGTVWQGGFWVWSDPSPAFTASYAAVHIQWLDAETNCLGGMTNQFTEPGTNWTWISVTATSPANTVWVRLTIQANGVGTNGALSVDDAVLGPSVSAPLAVQVGPTNFLGVGTTTNAVYTLYDGDLGRVNCENPFSIRFGAYDSESGLSRGNEGISTQMNATIVSLITNDLSYYSGTDSTPFTNTTASGAISVWKWTNITGAKIQALIDNGSNLVSATLFDADDDRVNDRSTNVNQQFGWLKVLDDDTNLPSAHSLKIWNAPIAETNLTDQEVHVGNWSIQMFIEDPSGIELENVGDTWKPNYSFINPAGQTCLTTVAFLYTSTSNSQNYDCYKHWAGAVSYDDVQTGTWQIVWSALDADEDRDLDRLAVTNSSTFRDSVNTITVIDDDQVNPLAPSNMVVTVSYWTNVNYFPITWDPGYDKSGIPGDGYRTYTNNNPGIDDGTPLLADATTNATTYTLSNADWEVGFDELSIPKGDYGETNGWRNWGSEGTYGHFDAGIAQSGTNSARCIIASGLTTEDGGRYCLISQYIFVDNTNDYPVTATFSGYFRGDLSLTGSGGAGMNQCSGFIKVEPCDGNKSVIGSYISNEQDDGINGRPLYGVNTGVNWSNVTLVVTSLPAATEYILVSYGLEANDSQLAATSWWDNASCTIGFIQPGGTYGAVYTNATEGSNTVYLYAVDDDVDRPNDQLMSGVTNFSIMYDKTTPTQVVNVAGAEGPDNTSEILMNWAPLDDGGGTNGSKLSPWKTYEIFYTDEQREPLNTDPSVTVDEYATLGTNTTTYIILSNFVFDTTYRLSIAGRDRAGNLGPLSTSVVVTLAGFYVTQGMVHASTAVDIFWTAATSSYGQITREYDLIYVDALDFTASLSNQWHLLASGVTNWLRDSGDASRAAPITMVDTMRFYRAAQHNYWITNRLPRVASAEVYGSKAVRLYAGQNWVSMPFIPDTATVARILGHYLPAGSTYPSPNTTYVQWYVRTNNEIATKEIWHCSFGSTSQWMTASGFATTNTSAEAEIIALDEGFIIEIPASVTTTQAFLMVGRVPTNTSSTAIQAGQAYNLTGLRVPQRLHPKDMNLLNSGFAGGSFSTSSDRLRRWNRNTQTASVDIWYNTTAQLWYWAGGGPVSDGETPFGPDDGIIIWTRKSTGPWNWQMPTPYPAPTRTMSP